MTADDAMDAVLIALAHRKGDRAGAALDATFDDYGFGFRTDPARGNEIAAAVRAVAPGTGDFAADLASIATRVFTRYGHPHDPAEVHATVARHLARP